MTPFSSNVLFEIMGTLMRGMVGGNCLVKTGLLAFLDQVRHGIVSMNF